MVLLRVVEVLVHSVVLLRVVEVLVYGLLEPLGEGRDRVETRDTRHSPSDDPIPWEFVAPPSTTSVSPLTKSASGLAR